MLHWSSCLSPWTGQLLPMQQLQATQKHTKKLPFMTFTKQAFIHTLHQDGLHNQPTLLKYNASCARFKRLDTSCCDGDYTVASVQTL